MRPAATNARERRAAGDDGCDVLGLVRIEECRRVTAGFGDRGDVRGRDGAAARHRLERWLAEAFVQAREDQAGGPAIEGNQFLAGDVASDDNAGRHGPPFVAAAGEHELELGPLLTQERERLEEPRVVLVRPRTGGVEEKWFTLLVARREAVVVDAERDRMDVLGRDAEPFDHGPAHELAVDDDCVGIACRPS